MTMTLYINSLPPSSAGLKIELSLDKWFQGQGQTQPSVVYIYILSKTKSVCHSGHLLQVISHTMTFNVNPGYSFADPAYPDVPYKLSIHSVVARRWFRPQTQ